MLIDTHVHLNNADLERDLTGMLVRAEAADVRRFVVVGWDVASSEKAVRQAEADERVYAVVGVHPHDAQKWDEAAGETLRRWAENPRVIAIGEIGLDFYRDLSPRPSQYTAFHAQLTIAQETQLPIVIHCRDAYPETLDLLHEVAPQTPLVLHCFAGDRAQAETAWENDWYLGVGGTVTYKKNEALRDIVRDAPRDLILLETDAPYLSPEPMRGKFPNEPARVSLVAPVIARIRGESVEDVAAYTTANAHRAFPRLS